MKAKGSEVTGYLSVDEIETKMRMSSGFLKFQKWLVIYNLLVDPRPLTGIARHTGLSESSVCTGYSRSMTNRGPESIETFGEMRRQTRFECA